jgi:hypothetical protein
MIKAFFYLFIAATILSVASCKKTGLDTDNGCITRVTRNSSISTIDSAADAQLFQQNNIPAGNLLFITAELNESVSALQKSNGLLVFNSSITFNFKKNLYSSTSGQAYNPTINLSITPKLSLPQVRKLFINAAASSSTYGHIDFTNTCLVAQFGYFDINGSGGTGPNIVPAWSVAPQQGYPNAYIRDDNKTVIYFMGDVLLN